MIRVLISALLLLLPLSALADEVWRTGAGNVVYESDEDNVAILSFPYDGNVKALVYFPGLAGNVNRRGTHEGFWIVPRPGVECGARMTGPDGTRSGTWGRATIIFHRPDFPSAITLLLGKCFAEWDTALVGTPRT